MTYLQEPEPLFYMGMTYEQASRRAQEVCQIASKSGQTVLAYKHLRLLMQTLERT